MCTVYAEDDCAYSYANQSTSHILEKSSSATQETKNNHCKILRQYAYVQHGLSF